MSTGSAWALLISAFIVYIVLFLTLAGVIEWLWQGVCQTVGNRRLAIVSGVALALALIGAVVWVAVKPATSSPGTGTHWAAIAIAIGTCVAACGVVFAGLGALWAGEQVKEAKLTREAAERDRKIGAVVDMAGRWEGAPMMRARILTNRYVASGELKSKYLTARDTEGDDYYVLQRIPNFFEDLAITELLEGVDLEVIRLALGSSVLRYWNLWEPIADEIRHHGQTSVWANFQALALKLNPPNAPGS